MWLSWHLSATVRFRWHIREAEMDSGGESGRYNLRGAPCAACEFLRSITKLFNTLPPILRQQRRSLRNSGASRMVANRQWRPRAHGRALIYCSRDWQRIRGKDRAAQWESSARGRDTALLSQLTHGGDLARHRAVERRERRITPCCTYHRLGYL